MAVNLSPVGGVAAQFFTNTGAVLTGGKLFTYLAGTTTPAASYTSSNGSTAWTNPIVLDAAGRVPGSGEIWITDGLLYKFLLKDANDVLLATYDNISGINSNFVAFVNQQEIVTATAGQTVFNLGISYQPGTNSLSVFVDGVNQYGPGAQYAYVETDADTVTFTSGLHVGAEVKFTTSQLQNASVGDASQVTYDPPFAGSVVTNVEDKLAQYVSVKDFGAVGDGVTNDTVAIQAALDAVAVTGGSVYAPAGTYRVSDELTVASNTAVIGDGIEVTLFSATSSMTSAQAMFYGNASDSMRFENFSILGNTNGTNGAGSGIHCKTGSGNQIRNVFISNTTQAGIRLEEQNSAWVDSCWLQSNGRTGYTDNHGIMVYSAAGSTVDNYNIKITNNKINNAFRKGITDYAPNADVYDILIDGNTVESCGLGGIYIGTPQGRDIRITNNYVAGCYVNIQYGPGTNSIIDGNNVQNATGDYGIGFYDSTNLVVSNNTVVGSEISGIDTVIVPGTRNSQVLINGNIVHNSNRSTAGFGPGIYIDDCDNAVVTGNIVYDDSGSILTTHGVVDGSGNVNCQIAANTVLNVTVKYLIQSTTGMLQDVTYGQTQDFLSGVKVAQNSVTLANGTNNNVAMPVRTGVLRATGPTGIYSITGITNGSLGRQLTLVNDTNFALTLEINDAGSLVGNRFLLTGGVDKVIAAYGSVTLMYVTVQGNNFWVDV